MNIDTLREHCLNRSDVEECFPFDETTLVFKIKGKIFCLASLDSIPLSITLKCDPDRAVELNEQYEAVRPGYHMNKIHWITLTLDGSVPDRLVREWIDHSCECVLKSRKKKKSRE